MMGTPEISAPGKEQSLRLYLRKAAAIVFASLLTAAIVAEGEATYHGITSDTASRRRDPIEQPTTPTVPVTSTTLGPAVNTFRPDRWTLSCSYSERTIKIGDTVFALTTVGLHDNEWFMNQVYAFNLEDIARQAETDPALNDPNNIPVGHPFKILDHCVEAGPVRLVYDYSDYDYKDPNYRAPSEYRRDISYQSYPGTDNHDHHNVTVTYHTDQAGALLDVRGCYPDPKCSMYVAGSP